MAVSAVELPGAVASKLAVVRGVDVVPGERLWRVVVHHDLVQSAGHGGGHDAPRGAGAVQALTLTGAEKALA